MERGAAPAGGGKRSRRTREALGNRPCPLRGAAFSGWTGQGEPGESPVLGEAKSRAPESRKYGPEVDKRREWGAAGAFYYLAPVGAPLPLRGEGKESELPERGAKREGRRAGENRAPERRAVAMGRTAAESSSQWRQTKHRGRASGS